MKEKIERYSLPKGWLWVSLSDVVLDPKAHLVDGPFGSNLKSDDFTSEGIPVFKIQNIKAGYFLDKNIQYVTTEKALELERHSFKEGDIIITKLGEPLGLACKVPMKYPNGIIVADLIRLRPSRVVNVDYLVHLINSKIVQDQFKEITKGTTRSRVNLTLVRDIQIPLATLNEQKLIVSQIDLLFSKLDEADKGLKKADKNLKIYRHVLSKSAFEGKLTTTWRQEQNLDNAEKILKDIKTDRKEYNKNIQSNWRQNFSEWETNGKNGTRPIKPKELQVFPYSKKDFYELPKLPTEWRWVHWNEVLDCKEDAFKRGPFGSKLTKSIFVKSGYKVYEQYCPINDDISFERYYITPEKYEELESFSVREGDYLVSCAGTIGKITQIPEKFKKGVINQALLRVRINKKYINNKFFLYFFRSPYFQKQIFENSKGSAIPNMKGVKELKIIPVPLLSIEEQKVIVEILESRFTLVDNLEKTVNNVLNEIIALKHSILKKAFEGRLVNYTSNESVEKLLKDIQEEKRSYIENQKELTRNKPKQKKKMEEKKSVLDILKESDSPIPAQELWEKSTSDGDIERFYSEIKEIYHQIDELKSNTESLLSLKDENK